MADEADLAQDQIEATLASAIRRVRTPKLRPTGCCHNCEGLLPPGLLFCDSACREDHEREEAARARSGRMRD